MRSILPSLVLEDFRHPYPLAIVSFLWRLNRLDKNPGEIRHRRVVSGNLDISHDFEKY